VVCLLEQEEHSPITGKEPIFGERSLKSLIITLDVAEARK
jgi:hypothetical protein